MHALAKLDRDLDLPGTGLGDGHSGALVFSEDHMTTMAEVPDDGSAGLRKWLRAIRRRCISSWGAGNE